MVCQSIFVTLPCRLTEKSRRRLTAESSTPSHRPSSRQQPSTPSCPVTRTLKKTLVSSRIHWWDHVTVNWLASSTVEIEVEDLNVAGVFNLDGLPPDFGGSRVFGARVCVWTALQVSDLVVLFLKSCKNYYSSLSTCVSHFVATCYHILYSFDIFRSKAPAMKLAKQFLFEPFLHKKKYSLLQVCQWDSSRCSSRLGRCVLRSEPEQHLLWGSGTPLQVLRVSSCGLGRNGRWKSK